MPLAASRSRSRFLVYRDVSVDIRGRLSPLDHGRSGRHLHQVLAALFAARGRSSLAFCWSHVRRRFYERFVADASPIAAEALQRIALIYAVEKDIRGRSPDQRRAARQERSRPVVAELEPWLRAELPLLSQKASSPAPSAMPCRVGRPGPLPRRRPARNDQQRRRARHPSAGPRPQELPVRRLRRRGFILLISPSLYISRRFF